LNSTFKFDTTEKDTTFYRDSERVISSLMYLCDQEWFANYLHFNLTSKSHCQQRSICENDGECLPNSVMYVCNKMSIDNQRFWSFTWYHLMGYQILQYASIPHQTTAAIACDCRLVKCLCFAIERTFVAIKGISFNKNRWRRDNSN
jgi:hypothetical protein